MPIVYYDGGCVYCYNFAIWLIQNGLSRRYQFAKLKSTAGDQLRQTFPEANRFDSVILQNGEQLQFKSEAIATLIFSLTKFKWLGALLKVTPNFISNIGYNFFFFFRNNMWKTHWHQPNAYEQSFFID